MSEAHYFMLFGAFLACGGLALAASNRSIPGRTVVKLLGAEITLAAAGGIVVILIGAVIFAVPTVLASAKPDISVGDGVNETDADRNINEAAWVPPQEFDSNGWNTTYRGNRHYWGVGTRHFPGRKSADCTRSLFEELRKSKIEIAFVQSNHIGFQMGETPISYLCSDGLVFVASYESPETNGLSDFNAALEIVDRTNFYLP